MKVVKNETLINKKKIKMNLFFVIQGIFIFKKRQVENDIINIQNTIFKPVPKSAIVVKICIK